MVWNGLKVNWEWSGGVDRGRSWECTKFNVELTAEVNRGPTPFILLRCQVGLQCMVGMVLDESPTTFILFWQEMLYLEIRFRAFGDREKKIDKTVVVEASGQFQFYCLF